MIVEDRTTIEKATPLYPEYMSSTAEENLILLNNRIKEYEDRLYSSRALTRELEEKVKQAKEEFNFLSKLFNIEYKKVDIGNKPETDNSMTGDVIQRARNQH